MDKDVDGDNRLHHVDSKFGQEFFEAFSPRAF